MNRLPLNLQRKIFAAAANRPKSTYQIGLVSKSAYNATKGKRNAYKAKMQRFKNYLNTPYTINYTYKNIPHKVGRRAEHIGHSLGNVYRRRENVKRNYKTMPGQDFLNKYNLSGAYVYKRKLTLVPRYQMFYGPMNIRRFVGKI